MEVKFIHAQVPSLELMRVNLNRSGVAAYFTNPASRNNQGFLQRSSRVTSSAAATTCSYSQTLSTTAYTTLCKHKITCSSNWFHWEMWCFLSSFKTPLNIFEPFRMFQMNQIYLSKSKLMLMAWLAELSLVNSLNHLKHSKNPPKYPWIIWKNIH